MKKITVLGAGLMGKAIAAELAETFLVTAVDCHQGQLEQLKNKCPQVAVVQADLTVEENLRRVTCDADIVVGSLPGHLGFATNETLLKAKKNVVDISFFPEDPFALEKIARDQGVTLVFDCGLAPGLGNIILGYHNARMSVNSYKCVVGGLPVIREWPYEYGAVFSPRDVIEEYTRPARFVVNSLPVTRPALSDPELIFFEKVGTLEAWNSDGLRSLIRTMAHIPNMVEKTIRYPGTIEYVKALRESGFFSGEPVEISGVMIRPVDLTVRLLQHKWTLAPGQKDITLMRITIEGAEKGVNKRYTYDLYDKAQRGVTSMARTTGYTCSAAVHLLARGQYSKPGICPPEYLGVNGEDYDFVVNYLKERKVNLRIKVETI